MNHPDADSIPGYAKNFALNMDNILENAALWEKVLNDDETEEWEEVL